MVNLVEDDSETTTTTSLPNPMMAILFFFIVTSIYCVLSLFIMDSMQRMIAKACYVIIIVIGQYFINLNLTESMCGTRQWQSSFITTIFPWFFIFGIMHLFLALFPGWKSPFSNTFGYLATKLMGLPDLMKEILIDVSADGPEASRALDNVKTDHSLLINELHEESVKTLQVEKTDKYGAKTMVDKLGIDGKPEMARPKFKVAWDKLVKGNIIKPEFKSGTPNGDRYMDKLYFFVQMKFTIAEYVWNILTGFLVTSISYNAIINSACAQSPEKMRQNYEQYKANEDKREKDKTQRQDNDPDYVQS